MEKQVKKQKIADIIASNDEMKSWKQRFIAAMQECGQYACPEKASMYIETIINTRPTYIITNDCITANTTLAKGLYSNLCPPGMRWFGFVPANDSDISDSVTEWLSNATGKMYSAIMNSNFTMELFEGLENFGWCALINLYVEEDEEKSIKFLSIHPSEYYLREDANGKIETVYREYYMTARQIFQEFPKDDLHPEILEYARSANPSQFNKRYVLIHAVEPNMDIKYDEQGEPVADIGNRPIKSYYIIRELNHMIRESGYHEMPYCIARYSKDSKNIYGHSPMQQCLRYAQMTNKILTSIIKHTEKLVDPPANIDINTWDKSRGLSPQYYFTPGAFNLYDSRKGNPPTFQPMPNGMDVAYDLYKLFKQGINDTFFVDLFNMLQTMEMQDKRQRTAYEISKLIAEKHQMIIPIISRMLSEFFEPLLKRCFWICYRKGLFGTAPAEMGKTTIKIEFLSPLALAAQQVELNTFFSALNSLAPIFQLAPSSLDYLDTDEATVRILEKTGVHPDFFRTTAEVSLIRKQRAKQQAQQQLMAGAMELAKSQDMNKTPQPDSMAKQLMGDNAMAAMAGAQGGIR